MPGLGNTLGQIIWLLGQVENLGGELMIAGYRMTRG
jgi:hypothetical protein